MLARTSAISGVMVVTLMILGIAIPGWTQTAASGAQSTTRLLPVSGVLTDAQGERRKGAAVVTFGLFDAQQDGTLLWTEVQEVLADDRGRFSAYLGTVSPVPQEVFTQEQARWLSIGVDGREQPRIMLVAVPYALSSSRRRNSRRQTALLFRPDRT